MKRIFVKLLCFAMPFVAAPGVAAQSAYVFDASKSTLEMDVYKGGLFSAFGHEHLIAAKDFSGRVMFDARRIENSSVKFRVAAKSLTVADPGVSEKDRGEVQAAMQGAMVLDAAKFPEISFASTGVTKAERNGDTWNIVLVGTLQLHGVQKTISLPVKLRLSGQELVVDGEAFLLQSDYGITPIKAAGGTVNVKNQLRIRFEIHAHP
jgi:polyisoprenoid-binding protein YceI